MNEELVDFFVERIVRNEIPFDEVRKELEGRGLDEASIKAIVKSVDSNVQLRLLSGSVDKKFDQVILVGLVLAGTGLLITVGSFMRLFSMSDSYLIIVAYGPLLGGLAIIFAGLRKRRRGIAGGSTRKASNVYKERRLKD